MHTCYIFIDALTADNFLSVRLDTHGEVTAELVLRDIDEIKQFQEDAKTVVVLSTELTAIHSLELPALSSNKARPVISYALEESLAGPVLNSHFAFDKKHYQHGKYLVAVIDRSILMGLQQHLAHLELDYDIITCDWFALNMGESCVISNRFIVHDVNFKGALSLDLFEHYLESQTDFSHILMFNDSPALQHSQKFSKVTADTYVWLAKRLLTNQPINFCQDDFAHKTNKDNLQKYYKLAMLLGGCWFFAVILSKIILLAVLNHNIAIFDKKIASLYRQFFPNAKQVISPKFRITQALSKTQAGYDARFWQLLAKFNQSVHIYLMHNHQQGKTRPRGYVLVKQINLQNNKIAVSLTCSDFEVLEKIETSLKQQTVKVQKSGVTSKGEKVIATLELS